MIQLLCVGRELKILDGIRFDVELHIIVSFEEESKISFKTLFFKFTSSGTHSC